MRQREPRSRASVPVLRLLLLGFLVVGLLQMHSFGHVGHDQGGASGPAVSDHMAAPTHSGSPHAPLAPESDMTLELLVICLAVITSVGVLGALIGLLAARPAGGGPRDGPLARLFAARGRPAATPPLIGNRLARLSVLRI